MPWGPRSLELAHGHALSPGSVARLAKATAIPKNAVPRGAPRYTARDRSGLAPTAIDCGIDRKVRPCRTRTVQRHWAAAMFQLARAAQGPVITRAPLLLSPSLGGVVHGRNTFDQRVGAALAAV